MTNRGFLVLCAYTVLLQAACNGARLLTSYRVLELGGAAVAIGLIAGSFALTPLASAVFVGRQTDGPRRTLMLPAGAALILVGCVLGLTGPSLIWLAIANAFLGLGQVTGMIAGQAVISESSRTEQLDSRFAFLTLSLSAGIAIGFPIAGYSMETLDRLGTGSPAALAFGSPVLLAAISLAFGAWVTWPALDTAVPLSAGSRQSVLQILRPAGMKSAIFSSLAVLAALDLLTAYVPLLCDERGLSVRAATWLLTVRSVAMVVSRLLLPVFLRLVNRRLLIASTTLVSTPPMIVLGVSSDLRLLLISMVIIGVFFGIGQPLTMTWVVRLASQGNRATALSLRLAGNRVGQVAVPVMAGGAAASLGVGAIFGLSAVILAAAGVTSWFGSRDL